MGSSSGQSSNYDLSFKILLIGDSAVGKSSLLVSFISNSVEDLSPTIGTFFFFFFFLIIFPVFNDLKCKIFDKANVIFRFLSNKTESNTVGSMTRFLSLSNGKKKYHWEFSIWLFETNQVAPSLYNHFYFVVLIFNFD